jgi:REP element-mobilizing transposase RayT
MTQIADKRSYYHVTMQPHRRLPALYGEIEAYVLELLVTLTDGAEVQVLEVGVVPTHIHLLLIKAPWLDLKAFLVDFQEQSSARIFARFPQLALDMRTNQFWTVGGFHYRRHRPASVEKVRRYIRNQKKHHGLE